LGFEFGISKNMEGKLIIFSAPSGSGKTTIVHRILDARNDLEFSVSACSRPMRANEKNGVDYYFMSAAYEMTFSDKFDLIIINDDLKKAVDKAKEAAGKFIVSR
jgi:guanylate kinase